MIVTFNMLLKVCIPGGWGTTEGGREGGSSRLFQSICLAISLQWTVFTAMAAEGLWKWFQVVSFLLRISRAFPTLPMFL